MSVHKKLTIYQQKVAYNHKNTMVKILIRIHLTYSTYQIKSVFFIYLTAAGIKDLLSLSVEQSGITRRSLNELLGALKCNVKDGLHNAEQPGAKP